jgi:eukaryotic translation initiation factor 2C
VPGADVTHPGGDSLEPSIASVVGSTNEFGSGYAAEFSVQPGRQEIISDLHHMVKVRRIFLYFSKRRMCLFSSGC